MEALAILVDRGVLWLSQVEGALLTEINQQCGTKFLIGVTGLKVNFCECNQWFGLTGTKYVSVAK